MAADYFLRIDGIEGESTKRGVEKQIEIESFSWSAAQTGFHGTGTGGGTAKVDVQDFHFTTKVNKSSPKLMIACATGQHFKDRSAVLIVRKAGGKQEAYLTYKLSDITISSYQTAGAAGDNTVPTDSFSIAFSKIEVEYKPQKSDGSLEAAVTAGYNWGAIEKV